MDWEFGGARLGSHEFHELDEGKEEGDMGELMAWGRVIGACERLGPVPNSLRVSSGTLGERRTQRLEVLAGFLEDVAEFHLAALEAVDVSSTGTDEDGHPLYWDEDGVPVYPDGVPVGLDEDGCEVDL